MTERVANPTFSEDALKGILQDIYGISGDLKPLVSFEDQNARLTTKDGRYVLKVSNAAEDRNFLRFQNALLGHLEATAPDLIMPRVVKTLSGEEITTVKNGDEAHLIRLLTYLDGDVFANVPMSLDLYRSLGSFAGRFSGAMASFSSDIEYTPNLDWSLDLASNARQKVMAIQNHENRMLIEGFYERYERDIKPKLDGFRTAFLHHDINEYNVLVNPDNAVEITGLIDFGDAIEGRQINELAICMGYAMITTDDPLTAAEALTAGYVEQFPITKEEADVVLDLACMRLVMSITLSSHRALDFPDNDYITISQKPGYRMLRTIISIPETERKARIMAAAGF